MGAGGDRCPRHCLAIALSRLSERGNRFVIDLWFQLRDSNHVLWLTSNLRNKESSNNSKRMSPTKDDRVIQVYLFFNGNCEEAVGFYRKALGAEVQMTMRYKEAPDKPPPGVVPSGYDEKIMHTSFQIGETTIMASDGCSTEKRNFNGFSLSLSVADEREANRAFAALADGGKVTMPLGKTFWSPCFGMLEDRFGVGWMISVTPADH